MLDLRSAAPVLTWGLLLCQVLSHRPLFVYFSHACVTLPSKTLAVFTLVTASAFSVIDSNFF